MYGHIYIIKLREHINTNESIYKIGKTEDIIRRFKQYPKGSKLLFSICTENMDEIENILKDELHLYLRKDLGSEYFECNINIIKSIIDKNVQFTDSNTQILPENYVKINPILQDFHIDILTESPFKKYLKLYQNLIKKNIDCPSFFEELRFTAEFFQNNFDDKIMIKNSKHNLNNRLKNYNLSI